MDAQFLHELNAAPLALLLWISGIGIVIFPRFVSQAAVSLWSILAILATGWIALQVNGYEYLLPTSAKISMVVVTVLFLIIGLVLALLTPRKWEEELHS